MVNKEHMRENTQDVFSVYKTQLDILVIMSDYTLHEGGMNPDKFLPC